MKNICAVILVLLFYYQSAESGEHELNELWNVKSPTLTNIQENSVIQLIRRLLPLRVNEFEVHVNLSLLEPDNKDKFIIESVGNKIRITGTSGIAAANGFNYYLKYFAHCHVSWSGDQLNVPSPLPVVKTPIHMTIQDKFRYYQNVCTVSYSFVWWDWHRWEREIDWMALMGINFPLAFNGQELIWQRVFQKFGLTKAEVDDYFSGPAFLAWNRMGNFQGWSGPLTDHWHKSQTELQKQILKRMRDFGMIPILPAFAGHVPKNITRVYPNSKVTRLGNWGGFNNTFCCTTFLQPEDPLFVKIGSEFIEEYKNEFGTDHFYNTDLFNEMTPKSKEVSYLSDSGKAVYNGLVKADPDAVWVMQGWLFFSDQGFWKAPQTKALLTSVPMGKMIILDLWSENHPVFQNFEGYYGQPWIWCMLQNFGGVLGLYGPSNEINSRVFNARNKYKNMLGIGLTPEGIEQNPVIYDFMMETIWHNTQMDLKNWFENYAIRRYGHDNKDIINAWELLRKSVYTDTMTISNAGHYVFSHRPSLNGKSPLWYNPKDVISAWELFINALKIEKLTKLETFRYDLVDITRQVFQLSFDAVYNDLILSYKASNHTEFDTISATLIQILIDLDKILGTDVHFLLGKWIQRAKSLGENDTILDYATKQWSGIVSHYYKPRWELFIKYLRKSLTDKTPFNQTAFNADVFNTVERPFVFSNITFSAQPKDDPSLIVESLHKKYDPLLKKHFSTFSFEYFDDEFIRNMKTFSKFPN